MKPKKPGVRRQHPVGPKKAEPRRAGVTTVWRPSVTTAQVSRRDQTHLIARGDIRDLFDDDGELKPLDTLLPEIACTVASVTRRRGRDGSEAVTIRMRDKVAALKRLAVDTGLLPSAIRESRLDWKVLR